MAISNSVYIKCDNCGGTVFQEMLTTKLLRGAAEAVKTAPLDTSVTPMFKEESEIIYKCLKCGHIMSKEDIAKQSGEKQYA